MLEINHMTVVENSTNDKSFTTISLSRVCRPTFWMIVFLDPGNTGCCLVCFLLVRHHVAAARGGALVQTAFALAIVRLLVTCSLFRIMAEISREWFLDDGSRSFCLVDSQRTVTRAVGRERGEGACYWLLVHKLNFNFSPNCELQRSD